MPDTAWLYFGLGRAPTALPPGEAGAVLSRFRPSPVIADIAVDKVGRGTYDVMTRAPGLNKPVAHEAGVYHIDSDRNGVLRLAHVTPDYVMGLGIVPLLADERWAAISSQNRSAGLVFSGGDPAARIAISVISPTGRSEYNALFGIQSDGLQVVRSAVPAGKGLLGVWFGPPLKVSDVGSWIFVDGPAYVAVRPVSGGWHPDPQRQQWMIPDDQTTAIILQAAPRQRFQNLASFIDAVQAIEFHQINSLLTVKGLDSTISMGMGNDGTLKIDGSEINFQPALAFDSPFVRGPDDNGRVVISKGSQKSILDFR